MKNETGRLRSSLRSIYTLHQTLSIISPHRSVAAAPQVFYNLEEYLSFHVNYQVRCLLIVISNCLNHLYPRRTKFNMF